MRVACLLVADPLTGGRTIAASHLLLLRAAHLIDLTNLLRQIGERAENFRIANTRADETRLAMLWKAREARRVETGRGCHLRQSIN